MTHHYLPKGVLNHTSPINIIVVGIGGTGSHLAHKLAKISLAFQELQRPLFRVLLIDDGEVRNTTHFRGSFSPFMIDGMKAIETAEYILRFYGLDNFDYLQERISETTTFYDLGITSNQCVIFITCTDTISSRKLLRNILAPYKIEHPNVYWMDIGNDKDFGQIILGTQSKITQPAIAGVKTKSKLPLFHTFFDDYFNRKDNNRQSCNFFETTSSQELFINDIMASHAAYMLYDFLINYNLTYQGMFINMETLTINPILL